MRIVLGALLQNVKMKLQSETLYQVLSLPFLLLIVVNLYVVNLVVGPVSYCIMLSKVSAVPIQGVLSSRRKLLYGTSIMVMIALILRDTTTCTYVVHIIIYCIRHTYQVYCAVCNT